MPAEIDALREQAADVRAAACAAADLARSDLADTQQAAGAARDQARRRPAGRNRRGEGRARAADRAGHDQRKPGQAMRGRDRARRPAARAPDQAARPGRAADPAAQGCLAAVAPGLEPAVAAVQEASLTLSAALRGVEPRRLARRCVSGEQDLLPLAIWAVVTIALWWGGRTLRHRFGRGECACPASATAPSPPPSTGVGLVLVPILAVWLIGRLLLATSRPRRSTSLMPHVITAHHRRPAGRRPDRHPAGADPAGLPRARLHRFQRPAPVDEPAAADDRSALASRSSSWPSPRAAIAAPWRRSAPWCWPARSRCSPCRSCPTSPGMPGKPRAATTGPRWSAAPGGPRHGSCCAVAILSSILFALLGYATLGAHIHSALGEQRPDDRRGAAGASRCRRPARRDGRTRNADRRLGASRLRPGARSRRCTASISCCCCSTACWSLLLAFGLPQAWNVDVDAIQRAFGQLLYGVRIGGVTISLTNVGMAILAFGSACCWRG